MSRINGFIGNRSRRDFLKLLGVGGLGIATGTVCGILSEEIAFSEEPQTNFNSVNADIALKRLLDGNRRFAQQRRRYPNQSLKRLKLISKSQTPFACILGCTDSRVPAEVIFDQGLGDLFNVRVAGNIASDMTIGSLEFATLHLGCQLILVLGHTRCGAIESTIEGKKLPGKISLITEKIQPALEIAKSKGGNIKEATVMANVQYQMQKLKQSSTILAKLIDEDKLKIVGSYFNLSSGNVSIIG